MRKFMMSVILLGVVACGKGDKADKGAGEKSGKPRDMVAERAAIAGFRDKACACKDAACANTVAGELKAWMMTDRGAAPEQTPEDSKKDLDVMTEFIKCLDAARAPK